VPRSAADDVEKIAGPRSSQQTTSPSIKHDRTLRWFTAGRPVGSGSSSRSPA
jgi:hypothetical protein